MCAHREPAYRREPWRCAAGDSHEDGACTALSESEAMTDEGLILPLFAEMTDEDQQIVAGALSRAIADENRRLFP
jgi:dTDP-4-amino-4,6-dideoxygalactose transaminase